MVSVGEFKFVDDVIIVKIICAPDLQVHNKGIFGLNSYTSNDYCTLL